MLRLATPVSITLLLRVPPPSGGDPPAQGPYAALRFARALNMRGQKLYYIYYHGDYTLIKSHI